MAKQTTLYVARSKKEFERVTGLLCELGIGWKNKANCGWNIEVNNNNEPTQLEPGDKEEYRLVLTIRQIVNGEQNMVCYDSLCAIYPTLDKAVVVAKKMRN